MFNEFLLVSAAGLLLARVFLCVVHSWFHSVKMCNCCFCAFPSSAEPQTTLRWRQSRLGPVKEDGKEEEEDRRHEYEGNEIY